MEIGPISGVRPVAMVRPRDRSADLGQVFAAELRHQGGDAEDAPNEKANRGLEEDDSEDVAEHEAEAAVGASDATISFFA